MKSPTTDGLPTDETLDTPFRKPTNRFLASAWVILAGCVSVICAYLTVSAYLENQVDLGTWGCRMSWMSPNYVRLNGPSGRGLKRLDRKYALWLYREGGLQPDLKPTGVPVLFIPGNAGSFKQVRSIASSAAHQFHERDAQHGSIIDAAEDIANSADWQELDFFATDFNEEFSAFHSATLEDQSLYVSHAIQYILDMYPAASPASHSIILVGHSMGGIVARHAVTRLTDPRVSTIITMSTPHLIPPVTFERGMQVVYDAIEAFWHSAWLDRQFVDSSGEGHGLPVLVSICGGSADTQISSDSCALEPLKIENTSTSPAAVHSTDMGTFAVFTTGMEGIWTGVDHQAMVWCDQVRRTVATTLLDLSAVSLDHSPHAIGSLRQKMTEITRRRFLGERKNTLVLQPKSAERPSINLQDAVHITADSPTFRHDGPGAMLLIAEVPDNATRLQIIGDMRTSSVGRTGGSEMLIFLETSHPQRSGKQTYRELPLAEIRILPKSAPIVGSSHREDFPLPGEGVKDEEHMLYVEAELEYEAGKEQKIVVELSGAAWVAVAFVVPDGEIRGRDKWKPIRQSHTFESVQDHALVLHELNLHRSARCTHSSSTLFSPIVEHVSHSNPATYESRFYPQAADVIKVHTHTSAAPYVKEPPRGEKAKGMTVNLWQDPNDACSIQNATVKVAWTGSLGLMVMRYRMTLLAWTMGIAALVAAIQFRHYRLDGGFPSFAEAIVMFTGKPLAVLLAALCVACLLQSAIIQPLTNDAQVFLLGLPHWHSAIWVLPVLSICYGLLVTVNFILCALTSILRVGLGWTGTLRFPRSLDTQQHFQPRHAVSVIVLVILVKLLVPHQLAFIVGVIVHLLSTSAAEISKSSSMSRLNLYRTLLFLLFMLVPANGAVLFVWIRNILVLFDKPSGVSSSSDSFLSGSFGASQSTLMAGRDHTIWQIVAVLVIVEACSAGKMPDVSPKYRPLCYLTEASLVILAITSFLVGPRYFYAIAEWAQLFMYVLAAWLVLPSLARKGFGK